MRALTRHISSCRVDSNDFEKERGREQEIIN